MTGGETIVTTVDHALIRGLKPPDPGFVVGLNALATAILIPLLFRLFS
jgi:hypothetical protein